VGHDKVARAIQGESRSGRRGWCSGPSFCPFWERQALNSGAGGEGGLQVRDRGREVREVEGRKEGGAPDRFETHGGRCEGRA